jgi:voltage-gated potassium channel Kch
MPNITEDEIKHYKQTRNYQLVAAAALGFIGLGGIFYHFVEDMKWLDAFYFTFVTLATVGYGDFVPKTDAGKIFTMFYILFGITIFIVLAKIILAGFAVRVSRHNGFAKKKR